MMREVLFALFVIGFTTLIMAMAGIAISYMVRYLEYDIKAKGETDENNGDESVANARRDEIPRKKPRKHP